MTYDELVTRLAHQTGLHSDVVKKVLMHLPDALMELAVDGDVRTPLGVFRRTQRKTRLITLPDGKTKAVVPQMSIVKLKSGSRLRSGDEPEAPAEDTDDDELCDLDRFMTK